MAVHAWLSSRADEQLLQSTLATQKQILDAADARERARDTALTATLAQIDRLKRATQTPTQIVRDLPNYLSLPQPITLAQAGSAAKIPPQQGTGLPAEITGQSSLPPGTPATQTPAANTTTANAFPSEPVAQLPAADLKPLYDYVQDCRACQAQLATAKQNASDDAAKIAALTRERDAAVTAAKGGSFLRRLRRNALWFLVGAAAGYAARR